MYVVNGYISITTIVYGPLRKLKTTC